MTQHRATILILTLLISITGCVVGEDDDPESLRGRTGGGNSNRPVTWQQTGYICFEDYSCYPLSDITCWDDGSCFYEERPPGEYSNAGATASWNQDTQRWDLLQPSRCDEWCLYLMASSPRNVSRWNMVPNATSYTAALPSACLVYSGTCPHAK